MSGIPTVKKSHRESFICYQQTHILLEVPSTDYSLSMGNFRGIFSLSKGCPLFLAMSVSLLLEGRLNLYDFVCVCDRVLFSLNKEFFPVLWKKLHFGVNFLVCVCVCVWGGGVGGGRNSRFFLRIYWSGVVGAIDTFVAEHVANVLSWLKWGWDFNVCPRKNFKTWELHFSDNQRENKTGGLCNYFGEYKNLTGSTLFFKKDKITFNILYTEI